VLAPKAGVLQGTPGFLQQQALTRRDFANEGDWEEYQASGMAPRQLEGAWVCR